MQLNLRRCSPNCILSVISFQGHKNEEDKEQKYEEKENCNYWTSILTGGEADVVAEGEVK